METAKYLCEFFFTNFWHYLGLLVIVAIMFDNKIVKIIKTEGRRREDENS